MSAVRVQLLIPRFPDTEFECFPPSPDPSRCAASTTDADLTVERYSRLVRDSLCTVPLVAVTWSERVGA